MWSSIAIDNLSYKMQPKASLETTLKQPRVLRDDDDDADKIANDP